MFFQDPPVAPPQASATEAAAQDRATALDDVVVIAERPTILNQIDRRIYDVSREAVVQTLPVIEVLERIPSVSVDSSGRLRLLGQPGITLLVDGQRPVSEQAILRTLTGSDIDRIEVMTNPGVQYGPSHAGIINIITRRRTRPGFSGSLTTSADTLGNLQASVSPSLNFGPWTVSGILSVLSQGTEERSIVLRTVPAPPTSNAWQTEELRTGDVQGQSATARLRVEYKVANDHRVSLGVEAYSAIQDGDRLGRFAGDGNLGQTLLERGVERSESDSFVLSASSTWTGPRDGEELTAVARLDDIRGASGFVFSTEDNGSPSSVEMFRTARRFHLENQSWKADYKRPLSDNRIVTAGGSWERSAQTSTSEVATLLGSPGNLFETRGLTSARDIVALYGTFQTEIGTVTVLPGLRAEYQALDIRSVVPTDIGDAFDLYPSLHVRWPVGEGLNFNLSYVKRIDRPDASMLDPTLIFSRALEATRGNPDLRPQTQHAFEARLDLTRPRYSIVATLYDKERSNLWTVFRERRDDGLIIGYPVNAGQGADRGLELSVRGKIGEHLSYAATANLFASTRLVSDGEGSDEVTRFRYLGNGQIEYAATGRDGLPGDRIQLSVTYAGPERALQTQYEGSFSAGLSWSHPVTARVSTVLTLRNVLNNSGARWTTTTDTFREDVRFDNHGIQVRLGLTYRFGVLP